MQSLRRNLIRLAIIFFFVWGVATLLINENDAQSFRMQNATIAALVNRQTFTLKELEVPDFRLIVGKETFRISEDIYPMKQPGQTVWGGVIYYFLKKMGINYQVHYLWTSSMVTMLSTASLLGVVAGLIWLITREAYHNEIVATITALATTLGTNLLVYSGVTHHDLMATTIVVGATYLYYKKRYFWAGVLAGLTTFFSMLSLMIPVSMWLVTNKKKQLFKGVVVGVLPVTIFNTLIFKRPWLTANLAGKVSDTVPLLSVSNFVSKLWHYLINPSTALWAFSPFLALSLYAIVKNRKKNNFDKLLFVAPLIQLIYISSIETYGNHQYGPRYLLPIIPILGIGLASWLSEYNKKSITKLITILSLGYSVMVAIVGAMSTAMYPLDEGYAPVRLAGKILSGDLPVYRVWKYGAVLLLISFLLLTYLELGRRQETKRKG